MTEPLTDQEHSALVAEASTLAASIRSNANLARGQLPFGIGLIAGAIGAAVGLLEAEAIGGLAALFGFLLLSGTVILFDAARVRAEVARLAGARRAIEQRLELSTTSDRPTLVWEGIHQSDYGELPPTWGQVEGGALALPQTLATGVAFGGEGRRRHYLRGYLDAATLLGLPEVSAPFHHSSPATLPPRSTGSAKSP